VIVVHQAVKYSQAAGNVVAKHVVVIPAAFAKSVVVLTIVDDVVQVHVADIVQENTDDIIQGEVADDV
jgi:hypothetical protein